MGFPVIRARAFLLLFLFLAMPSAFGAPVWIVGGKVVTPVGGCAGVRWYAGALFHNFSDAGATVRVVHISNASVPRDLPPAPPITVPPHASVPIPTGGPAVSVTEYDVDPSITVEPRLELYDVSVCPSGGLPLGAPPFFAARTKLRMPLFTRLAPPGELQRHLGTDLGATPVRLNVGIYNAGPSAANATITVTQPACARTGVTSVGIAADTFTQFAVSVTPCGGPSNENSFAAYTTVVVDQPSLSMVSVLANGVPPAVTTAVTGGN